VRPDATYADNSSSAWGYAIGGGLAYAITPNFSIKGEYLYVNMRADTSGTLVASTPNFGTVTSGNRTDSFSVVRLGLDYKFFAF
jgi:outer membrane immunogenic protein